MLLPRQEMLLALVVTSVWQQGCVRSSSLLISRLFIPALVLPAVLDLQSCFCGRE